MGKSWEHNTRGIRCAAHETLCELERGRISSWRPSKLGWLSDKDAFQTTLHLTVHSVGVWPPCGTIDKHMDELANALHFVAALLE